MERNTASSKNIDLIKNCAERVITGLNGTPEARVVEKVYNELCDLDSTTDGLEILQRFQGGICFMNCDKEYFLTYLGSAYTASYGSHNAEAIGVADFFSAYAETLEIKRST